MKILNSNCPYSSDWTNIISEGQLPWHRPKSPTKSPTHKVQNRPRVDVSVLQLYCE